MDERTALYHRTPMKGILSRIGGWRRRDFLRKWPLSWDLKDKRGLGSQSAWVEEMKVVFNLCKDPEAEGGSSENVLVGTPLERGGGLLGQWGDIAEFQTVEWYEQVYDFKWSLWL